MCAIFVLYANKLFRIRHRFSRNRDCNRIGRYGFNGLGFFDCFGFD